jgi:hypothetical protein
MTGGSTPTSGSGSITLLKGHGSAAGDALLTPHGGSGEGHPQVRLAGTLSTRGGSWTENKAVAASVAPAVGGSAVLPHHGAEPICVPHTGLGRLLDELRLFPTGAQIHLVDKKFGGNIYIARWEAAC